MFTFPIYRSKKPEPGILGILDKESPAGFLVLVASLKRHPSWFLMLLNELFDDRLYHIHDKKLLEQGKCGLDFIHKLIVEHLTQIWTGPRVQAMKCW